MLVESEKGINIVQRWSFENQKGAIALRSLITSFLFVTWVLDPSMFVLGSTENACCSQIKFSATDKGNLCSCPLVLSRQYVLWSKISKIIKFLIYFNLQPSLFVYGNKEGGGWGEGLTEKQKLSFCLFFTICLVLVWIPGFLPVYELGLSYAAGLEYKVWSGWDKPLDKIRHLLHQSKYCKPTSSGKGVGISVWYFHWQSLSVINDVSADNLSVKKYVYETPPPPGRRGAPCIWGVFGVGSTEKGRGR